ncbi:hypothetical protein MDA_GLEAN10002957 [Myotis davidii]|uniref:Uncharacterized protein n=1 Tax=Myotis davidii TaxID=225400 RepID=L5M667_MYODS|nr:hypothetical protein MDA_GLEAN10002957 [Myotis davidii]
MRSRNHLLKPYFFPWYCGARHRPQIRHGIGALASHVGLGDVAEADVAHLFADPCGTPTLWNPPGG